MAETLLQLLQGVCRRIGIRQPGSIISNQDKTIQQLLEAANMEIADLVTSRWQVLTKEAAFTTVASYSQGSLATLAPNLSFIINDTIWDRTLRRPVFGPKTSQEWQARRGMNISGPYSSFIISGGAILFQPIPPAGHNCVFNYVSAAAIVSSTGEVTSFKQDADTILLPEELFKRGVVCRWKQMKGFDYSGEASAYAGMRRQLESRDGGAVALDMSSVGAPQIGPGIMVPPGSWLV